MINSLKYHSAGILLAALTMSVATACGGPALADLPAGSTSAPTTTVQAGSACGLVTVAEASTAAGTPMKVAADGGPIGECIFAAISDQSNVMYLEVDKSQVDIDQRKQQLESSSEHVAGLGDDAFWNGTVGEVFLQTGARALIITLPSLSNLTNQPAANKQRMIALARSALARL